MAKKLIDIKDDKLWKDLRKQAIEEEMDLSSLIEGILKENVKVSK